MPPEALADELRHRLLEAVPTFVRENPELVALAAVSLAVLLVGGALALRNLRGTTGGQFRRALADLESVAVLMHPNPDPDAMACALAVTRLAETVDTEAVIQHPGRIRHQENRAFETVLNLDCDRVERAGQLAAGDVVLVDHNEPRGFEGAETVTPYAVIDHHPGPGIGTAFTDVRTDAGACASILAGYFADLGWTPAEPDGESNPDGRTLDARTATGLLYGIHADTDALTNGCSPMEFAACEYLYDGIDPDALDRIANPQVDAEVLDVKARAISNRDVRHAFAVSHVGEVSNVDAIPQAADELLQLEGVTAVVVAGENDGTVHLSGRSRDDRVHMGKSLRAAVTDIPAASAGGHARMGGGQVPYDGLEWFGFADADGTELTERLFSAMAGTV